MQVVLQVVDENVARGSKVFETGHVRALTTHNIQFLCPLIALAPSKCLLIKS